jgi:hypothetical protein
MTWPPLLRCQMVVLLCLVSAGVTYAVRISAFTGIDRHVTRSSDIIVATCTRPPRVADAIGGRGLLVATVDIVHVVKGDKKPGPVRVATLYPMTAGKRYLISSYGGQVADIDILAIPELSVVEVPDSFDLSPLASQTPGRQLTQIFNARLEDVLARIGALASERDQLRKALGRPLPNAGEPKAP